MKNKILFLALFFVFIFSHIKSSHIVGGNFEMEFTGRGYLHNIYMNMYFDKHNANPGLIDADIDINVRIFSKATNAFVKNVKLHRQPPSTIPYAYDCPAQNNDQIETLLLRYYSVDDNGYATAVNLAGLTEPQGYYIAWERCCRNYQTLNIVHTDFSGTYISGQVFYLEFPPVDVAGVKFINSSPRFKAIPAEFLCQNNFTFINFSANDNDGDSLVYKMTNPKQGHTTSANDDPLYPSPGPYALIGWQPGYSTNNAIHGSPSLSINSSTGILSVNPSELGLFAFSVVCEEYRNGVKIGEVQRDFQYLVEDCPITFPPSVGIDNSAGIPDWSNTQIDTIVVKLNKDTCYTIYVTDTSSSYLNKDSNIKLRKGKTTVPENVISFIPESIIITPNNDTTALKMCFSTCDKLLITKDSVYYLDIIAVAETCPQKYDTLRTYVYVDVEENNTPPQIGTSIQPVHYLITHPDSLVNFIVYGKDIDPNDIKEIEMEGVNFRPEFFRMQFKKIFKGTDSLAYKFTWVPKCEDMKDQLLYTINFTLKDKSCIYTHYDTTSVTIRLEDVDTGLENLVPPNLITPNDDGKNDCLYLPNLPPDNCTVIFRSIEIYNRWGARVYMNSDRNFQWCASDVSEGIYYYVIDLSEKLVKGWVQVLR
jgi:hypothetical protein